MIKTRFHFELLADKHHEQLSKEMIMPFLVKKGDLFSIDLALDGEVNLVAENTPVFDLTLMSLSVSLGQWVEDSDENYSETLNAFKSAGWRTFEEEYDELYPEANTN